MVDITDISEGGRGILGSPQATPLTLTGFSSRSELDTETTSEVFSSQDGILIMEDREFTDDRQDEAEDDVGFPDEFEIKYEVYQDEDGEWFGKDEHGTFNLDAGSVTPPDPDDYSYEPCGAVLSHSYSRYGERRYCEGMAASNFDEDVHDREYQDFCTNHQARGAIMDSVKERSKHLAFASSFETMFEYLDAHKKVLAIEMFRSLLDESRYDFEPEETSKRFPVEDDNDLFPHVDEVTIEFPVPSEHTVRAKSLYFAALNYVQMENIMEEQFRVAAEETGPDGEQLAVGERTKVVSVTDEGRVVEDRDEHHLNLPLSRIQKDYERHLKVGGVEVGEEEEVSEGEARQWVFTVEQEQDDPAPEATSGENPMTELDTPEE